MPLSSESCRVNYRENIILKREVNMNYLPEISFQVYDSQGTEIFGSWFLMASMMSRFSVRMHSKRHLY